MKKVLSLVLALAMVLGSFSFVSAADLADVTDPVLKKAVDRLSLLEVLTGYPDGTFKPEQTITRAEFAAVAVRVKGLENAANAAKGLATGFTDVAPSFWASGYVGTAGKLGIVNGVGNGLFAPNAPVKYEEAITMIVRALGYEAEAQTKGGYPYGYLIVANDRGLLDDVKGTQGMPASRGIVAQITDNALEIPKMIQVGFGSDAKWVVSGSKEHGDEAEAQYLLHDLGIVEIKGYVTNNFRTKNTVKADEVEIKKFGGSTAKYDIAEGVDTDAVLGTGVTAWAKDDVVFSISMGFKAKQSGKDFSFEEEQVIYDTIVDSKTDDKEVFLYDLDDEYDWASRPTVYVNNKQEDPENLKDGFYGRFVLNEDDEIEFAYLFDIADNDTGLVTAIDKDELDYINLSADEDVLALDDAEEIYVFNKDLSQAKLEDITKNTAVFYWIDSDDNYHIVVSNDPLEGTLEAIRVRDNRVTVANTNITVKEAIFSANDGEEFETLVTGDASGATDAASEIDFETIEEYIDEKVVAYYNLAGDLLALVTDADVASGKIYGVATWLTGARNPELSVYTAEGKEVDYTFEDRKDSNGIAAITNGFDPDRSGSVTGVYFKVNKDGEIKDDTFDFVSEYNAGEELKFVKDKDDKYAYFNAGGTIGGTKLYITEDTVVLKALNSNGELKPSVIKYDDIIGKTIGNSDFNDALLIKGKGNDIALLIFTDKQFQGTDSTQYGILTSDPVVRTNGNYRVDINVAGKGEELYTIAKLVDARDLRKGDLIKFTLNTNGEVVLKTAGVFEDLSSYVASKSGYAVTDKNGDYLDIGSTTYKRTKDTIFYQVNEKGNLDGTGSYGRLNNTSTVIFVANNDDELKVVLDLTPFISPRTSGGSGTGTLAFASTGSGTALTVTGLTYDSANTANNKFMVRVTGGDIVNERYSDVKELATDGTLPSFDLGSVIPANGYYKVELVRTRDDKVVETNSRVFLEK